jgi:hypothetical protein
MTAVNAAGKTIAKMNAANVEVREKLMAAAQRVLPIFPGIPMHAESVEGTPKNAVLRGEYK